MHNAPRGQGKGVTSGADATWAASAGLIRALGFVEQPKACQTGVCPSIYSIAHRAVAVHDVLQGLGAGRWGSARSHMRACVH
jgi:hypothetical protein